MLKKQIEDLENKLQFIKTKNKTEEQKMREDYKRADRVYTENLTNYDAEMKQQTKAVDQTKEQFEQVHHELGLVSEEYKSRIEERKKREEMLAIM